MKNSRFIPTAAMISAAETLTLAMAHTQTIRPIIEAIYKQSLVEGQYQVVDKWDPSRTGVCLEESMVYLLSDEDMSKWVARNHELYVEAGFSPEYGYCPLLVAERLEREATMLFIDIMAPVTTIDYDMVSSSVDCVENIKKLKDLILQLVVPFLNSKQILSSLKQAA